MKMREEKDVKNRKYGSNQGFPDFPEGTIKQKLMDGRGLLGFSKLSE